MSSVSQQGGLSPRFVWKILFPFLILCFIAFEVWQWLQRNGAMLAPWAIGVGVLLLAVGITWAVWRVSIVVKDHKRIADIKKLELEAHQIDNELRKQELEAKQWSNQIAKQNSLLIHEVRVNNDNAKFKYGRDGMLEEFEVIRSTQHVAIEQLQQQILQLSQAQSGAQLLSGPDAEKDMIPVAPRFSEMSHLLTPEKMVLCYTSEGPAYGTTNDLLSMAITGKPGRGKTTALMYYVTMLLQAGAEVWVWDPHGAMNELAVLNGKPLQGMPATAKVIYLDRKPDIVASVPKLQKELADRDEYYRLNHKAKHPLLLLADELPVLANYDEQVIQEYKIINKQRAKEDEDMEEVPSLIYLIRRFVLEARKWRCFFIGSGQSIDAEMLPTKVIDALNSRIIFFNSDRKARMSGLENDAIKTLLPVIRRAGSGVMIFDCSRWDKPMIGSIPMIEVSDMLEYLGVSSTTPTATVSTSKRPDFRIVEADHEVDTEVGMKPSEAVFEEIVLTEREQMVFDLLISGETSQNQIIQKIWGVNGGDKYQKAAAELRIITAKLLKARRQDNGTEN